MTRFKMNPAGFLAVCTRTIPAPGKPEITHIGQPWVVDGLNGFEKWIGYFAVTTAYRTEPDVLSSPWVKTDTGNVGFPGTADSSDNALYMSGSGINFWDGDEFTFVHMDANGDWEMSARVVNIDERNRDKDKEPGDEKGGVWRIGTVHWSMWSQGCGLLGQRFGRRALDHRCQLGG